LFAAGDRAAFDRLLRAIKTGHPADKRHRRISAPACPLVPADAPMTGAAILAVILGMPPCGIVLMFGGFEVVAECDPGVVRRLFVIARFVMLGCLTMMFCGLLIVLGRVLVKLVDLRLSHFVLPEILCLH
jgi:hypothetical protein